MTKLKDLYSTIQEDLCPKDLSGESGFSRHERNIRINIYHGIANIISLNLAAPFIGIYAIKIGASNLQVGLLSSGPALVSLLCMIPGGKYMDRQAGQKKTLSSLIFFHRLFYFLIALIPFFTEDKRASLLVAAVALMNIPGSVFNVGWQAYISKVIPASRRADAFAARNRLMNLAGTIVVLVTGRVIDAVRFPVGYQIVFAGAFAMALVEIWVFGHIDQGVSVSSEPQREPLRELPAGQDMPGSNGTGKSDNGILQSIINDIRQVFKNGPFVRFMLASLVFHFSWQTPWPLFTLYQVKELGANNTWVSLLSLANTGGSLVGYGFWARMLNKHGNLMTLFMSSIWIFIVPTVYAFSKSLATIAVFNLLTGAIFSGVNLALFNALLDVTPDSNKATYIAYYTTAINASAIVAPVIGVRLNDLFGFFWAFLICAALRVIGSLMFLLVNYFEKRMPVPGNRQVSM
jgi:MFS family permease